MNIDLSRLLAGASTALFLSSTALSCCLGQELPGTKLRAADARPSSQYDERSVLQHLVQFDSIFMSGFTASATQHRTDPIDSNGPFYRVKARWRLTFEGNRTGYVMEVTDNENPKYLAPEERPWAAGNKAALGEVMQIAMRIRDWGYWGDEASGNHYVDASLEVNPDGQVTKAGTIYDTGLYPPRSRSPIAAQYCFQWGLGRFFSGRLDRITRVEEFDDGRLSVSALGNRNEGKNGKWKLLIDPDAAWMVREARFYPENTPDQIVGEMMNTGTVWSGSFCIPKEAHVNFFGPIEDMESVRQTRTQHLMFEPVVSGFDEQFYKECERQVLHGDHISEQSDLTVTDERVVPPIITKHNLVGGSVRSSAMPAPPASPSRWWLVFVNMIAAIFLLTMFSLFRRRKNANAIRE